MELVSPRVSTCITFKVTTMLSSVLCLAVLCSARIGRYLNMVDGVSLASCRQISCTTAPRVTLHRRRRDVSSTLPPVTQKPRTDTRQLVPVTSWYVVNVFSRWQSLVSYEFPSVVCRQLRPVNYWCSLVHLYTRCFTPPSTIIYIDITRTLINYQLSSITKQWLTEVDQLVRACSI